MASLYKRNGTYYASFSNTRRDPEQKRFSLKTSKKQIARRTLTRLEDDYHAGEFDPWTDDPWSYDEEPFEDLSLQEATDRFLRRKEDEGCSSNTIRTYREILRLLQKNVGGGLPMSRLSEASLRAFIQDEELGQATQHKRYGHVLTFLRWCEEECYLQDNPLDEIPRPRQPEKLPKAITEEELQTLCNHIRSRYKQLRKKNWIREGQNIWRIPLFWFAFYTGMRGEELARLRWRHIDFEKGLIYIRKQKNRKEQTIPLNSKAREVLEDMARGESGDYVFRSPSFEGQQRKAKWFRENVSTAFKEAREDVGLRKELSFHSLRHGFCTALAEAGKSAVVIKAAARHSDITTSMRYVHMARTKLQQEVEDAFR